MKITCYKGLYTLTRTKEGITAVIASSWDRNDIERTKTELERSKEK